MTKPTLEFWFDFASTYSHIAAQRIGPLAAEAGVAVVWRPFLLGAIFKTQGWTDSPFNLYPAKGAYMWRDMERECARLGVPFRKPSRFPRASLLAARIATAADGLPFTPALSCAIYKANFVDDLDIGDAGQLRALVRESGCPDPDALLAEASSAPVKQRLRERTGAAAALGVFGAPTFVAGGEIFWGADRIEQAMAFAGRPSGSR